MTNFKNIIGAILLPAFVFFTACSSGDITYRLGFPLQFDTIGVSGLKINQEIIELSDNYLGEIADGRHFFVIMYEPEKGYYIGSLDIKTGDIIIKEPFLKEYGEKNSIYWDKLTYPDDNSISKALNCCCSMTPFGGEVESYGFNAEKNFWGDTSNRVKLSYSYSKEQAVEYEVQPVNTGETPCVMCFPTNTETKETFSHTLAFNSGEIIRQIDGFYGYENAFRQEAIRKTRFYPLTQDKYAAFQPYSIFDYEKCLIQFYDLQQKKSWGAEIDFHDSKYVDGAVTRDGKTIIFLIVKEGVYSILKTDSQYYAQSLISLKAINE